MTRAASLSLVLLAFASQTLALSGEFVLSVSTPSTSVATGGPITFTVTVRNAGTEPTPSFGLSLRLDRGRLISTKVPNFRQTSFADGIAGVAPLGAGESRTFEFSGRAINDADAVGQMLRGGAIVNTIVPDDQPVFRSASAEVPITMSAPLIDLALAPQDLPGPPRPIGITEQRVLIRNNGPSAADGVTVTFSFGVLPPDAVRPIGADAPWTCSGDSGNYFSCTTPRLDPGQTSTLMARFETFFARSYAVPIHAFANDATDTNASNNSTTDLFETGVASDFARVLIPLLVDETPGARATWTSEISAIGQQNGTTITFCFLGCPIAISNAFRLFPGRQERLWPFSREHAAPRGAMLYLEKAYAARTTFSARLFSSRSTPSRGVELPIVREAEWRTDAVIIPRVVVDPSHRFMIRVYDPDATPHAGVIVRVFEHDVSRVLAERTIPLETRPDRIASTGLPGYPGYAEASDIFDGIVPAEGSRQVGVAVFGITPGLRLWAFVSATENEGEHVTLITPQ